MKLEMYRGRLKACPRLDQEAFLGIDEDFCRAMASFREAHESRDPGRCRGDPLCGALMGSQDDLCEVYGEKAKESYCRQITGKAESLNLRRVPEVPPEVSFPEDAAPRPARLHYRPRDPEARSMPWP